MMTLAHLRRWCNRLGEGADELGVYFDPDTQFLRLLPPGTSLDEIPVRALSVDVVPMIPSEDDPNQFQIPNLE